MCDFKGHLKEIAPVPTHFLTKIQEKLDNSSQIWELEDAQKPNKFGVFQNSAQHIVFQFPRSLKTHKKSNYRPVWDTWQELITPLVTHIAAHYGYKQGRTTRIMLAKLLAGRQIGPHIDGARAAKVPHKIHVPIQTNEEIMFVAENKPYHLKRGFAYEVNNRVLHGGINPSNTDRIHLIFDYFNEVNLFGRIRQKLYTPKAQ